MMRSALSVARRAMSTSSTSGTIAPKKVAVTGAAGAIGYALLMRIASGQIFGPNVPIELQLIETENGMKPLKGVTMEIMDGAFPLIEKITQTSNPHEGFGDIDVAILVGAQPRLKGMERKDLLQKNAQIFSEQGKALNESAKTNAKILVVGNPANTNALITASNAPNLNVDQFMAMTRLDQNRAIAQLANKTNTNASQIEKVVIWGNHSSTQYPDISNCLINGNNAKQLINDDNWIKNEFIPRVQKRGAEIINARGKSSAASAASAAIDNLHDIFNGSGNAWQSIAVHSDGSYGIDKDIWYSVPCICQGDGVYHRVLDIPSPDEYSAAMMDATRKELLEERDAIRHLLPGGEEKPVTKTTRKRKTAKKATA